MSDRMTFPNTVEEFMEQYKVVDTEGIYMSKGSELVPIFRMKQWFEHKPERKKGKWIDPGYDSIFTYVESYAKCDQCGKVVNYGREMNFCPNCGADMRGEGNDET